MSVPAFPRSATTQNWWRLLQHRGHQDFYTAPLRRGAVQSFRPSVSGQPQPATFSRATVGASIRSKAEQRAALFFYKRKPNFRKVKTIELSPSVLLVCCYRLPSWNVVTDISSADNFVSAVGTRATSRCLRTLRRRHQLSSSRCRTQF